MPAYTIKFQKPSTLPTNLEPEVSMRKNKVLHAPSNTAPFTDNRLQREVSFIDPQLLVFTLSQETQKTIDIAAMLVSLTKKNNQNSFV